MNNPALLPIPEMLAAYRARVEVSLDLLRISAAATRTGLVAHGVMAGRVRAELDRLDAQGEILARKDAQAAAIFARATLTIEGLMQRFSTQHKRAIKAQSKARGRKHHARR